MLGTAIWGNSPLAYAADLAVVIDDVGYSNIRGVRAIDLPGPVTIAVLPHAPHARQLAAAAAERGHDVIVHQPMQSTPSPHARSEHGTLTLHMQHAEFDTALSHALDAIPQSIGLSNHTGSLLTQHRDPMQRVMSHLINRGLFFLDSRTTPDTVALTVAREQGVPALRRDVFLDHDPSPQAVHAAFERALQVARSKGHAVLIGHPYPISLDYLERRLHDLPPDINLVGAAQLARRSQPVSRPAVLVRQPGPMTPHISLGR